MKNREILELMVEDYKIMQEVEAIVLGGSSTANTSDNHSDFDIYIYYKGHEPNVEKRRTIAEKYSDNPEIDNHYFETGDVYVLKETGKPIDIMYRSIEGIEANIKWVWEECNACLGYTTCFVDNVNKSEILFDRNGWFKSLQDRTKISYPEKLAENIIKKNFAYLKDAMFSYYDQLKSAVLRGDYVSINHRSAAFIASCFDIVFAMNKILNPGEKKLVEFAVKNCRILPENFEEYINILAVGKCEERLVAARHLVENFRKILHT